MSLWKKAVSVGTSAALLASLLVTVAAPAALASVSLTGAGVVAQGTTSAGTATILFTENSASALGATGYLYVDIAPAAPGAGTVSWAGTPVISAPDSLGASVSISGSVTGNRLSIRILGYDNANVETISITGLKVKASSTASPGAVVATLSDSTGLNINQAGSIVGAFQAYSATVTATGKLAQAYGIGTTSFAVANDPGSCLFSGTNNVTVGSEVLTGIAVSAANTPVPGQQTITSNPSTTNHLANEVVSQTVPNCVAAGPSVTIASPATVVRAASYYSDGNSTVYPGENNSWAEDLWVDEPAAGFLTAGTTLTYTILTDGVVFSRAPLADVHTSGSVSAPSLSADRKSFTVTVTAASTAAGQVHVYNILYDVAASVPGGTYVEVGLALSGGLLAVGSPATNAIVFRGITASAPTPTVYIGENNQATGLVTLTELAAGFFQSGTGSNNVLAVCTTAGDYSFTFAPWAKVTGGNLVLREGSVASTDNIVQGTYDGMGCYLWYVWTGSTTASTIVIGNSTFSSGPLINVDTDQAPGIVAMRIYSGDGLNYTASRIATVPFAVAAFRNQVAVTALAQPVIPTGAKTKAGAIQIAETANGQLKYQEDLCFEIVPRSSIGLLGKEDVFMQALTTADLPVVTATGGLVVGPVQMSSERCGQPNGYPVLFGGTTGHMISFSFPVLQQSTSGAGKLVVDNINLVTTADAASGPVLFNVYGYGGSPTQLEFQATVSNAKVGVKPAISIGAVSALGVNPTSGYSTKTPKVQAAGKYITWKFTGGAALAGQRVNVLKAVRINGAWGGPAYLKSAWADANGIVTVTMKASAGTVLNLRVQWPGAGNLGVSTSKALGAHWK